MADSSLNDSTQRIIKSLQSESENTTHDETHRELLANAATIIRDLSDDAINVLSEDGTSIARFEGEEAQSIIQEAVRFWILSSLERTIREHEVKYGID